ncbi:MAG: hypothetical protein P8Z75_14875 [Gammaproteobacteria bacterium]|jgi:hypothetical protein
MLVRPSVMLTADIGSQICRDVAEMAYAWERRPAQNSRQSWLDMAWCRM